MMTKRVDLRFTHPNLYRSAMVFALISVGLGLNFILTKPTFNPFQVDRHIIGAMFLSFGLCKLVALTIVKKLKLIRLSMAACAGWMMFWGLGTATTYFTGQTSLQLFVLYTGLMLLQVSLLFEPYVNPLTGSNGHVGSS